MWERRDFIKTLGTLLASSAVGLSSAEKLLLQAPSTDKSWDILRTQFSIEKGYHFFNNGTIGPSPVQVEEALIKRIREVNKTLSYSGGHKVQESIAGFINCDKEEIAFTQNTTEGLNIAAWGLPLKKGDEVIISAQEHVGNAMPWLNRAKLDGIKVKTFWPKPTQTEILNQIESLISRRTRVISVPHISCTVGQLFPVNEICKLGRDKDIYTVIDGAHGAGAFNLDMQEMNPDFYATCGHKWLLGPKGTGFLYVKKELLPVVVPIHAGAYTDKGFDITVNPPVLDGYSETAHRFDYGTHNSALRAGTEAAIDFFQNLGMTAVQERILGLNNRLFQQLSEISHLQMLNHENRAERTMMLGFKHKSKEFREVYNYLRRNEYRVRIVPESGLDSVRISTHIYNSEQEVDELAELLKNFL